MQGSRRRGGGGSGQASGEFVARDKFGKGRAGRSYLFRYDEEGEKGGLGRGSIIRPYNLSSPPLPPLRYNIFYPSTLVSAMNLICLGHHHTPFPPHRHVFPSMQFIIVWSFASATALPFVVLRCLSLLFFFFPLSQPLKTVLTVVFIL